MKNFIGKTFRIIALLFRVVFWNLLRLCLFFLKVVVSNEILLLCAIIAAAGVIFTDYTSDQIWMIIGIIMWIYIAGVAFGAGFKSVKDRSDG